jgi:hypothetical protein
MASRPRDPGIPEASGRPGRPPLWLAPLLLALLLATGCLHPAPPQSGAGSPAVPDPVFDRLFARGNGGWTGGDGTLSVALGDGRTLWLFGDSFLGRVDPDGSRPVDTLMVRNCVVVQDGHTLTTLHGETRAEPDSFFPPLAPGEWCWPADATVEGDRVRVLLHRYRQPRPVLWDWQWTGTAVASLGLPALEIEAVTPLAVSNGVMYGAILEAAEAVYIFGVAEQGAQRRMHLARAPPGNLLGPWEFFDGTAWSTDPARTRPVLTGVSTQFAVAALEDGLALVTMDNRVPFSADLVMYRSRRPEGPWQGPCPLYRAPEASAALAAYNPFVHPQFTADGLLLVSYNLNHVSDPEALYRDAAIYRPRFIRVDPAACPAP